MTPRSRTTAVLGVAALVSASAARGAAPAPINDDCADAVVIDVLPFRLTEPAISLAGAAPGDPVPSCTGGHAYDSIWFSYTPEQTGRVLLTTRTSWQDSFIWVGTGSCGSLEEIACADDTAGFFNAEVGFVAEAGTTYRILAGSTFPVAWGILTLIVEAGEPLNAPPPANDRCADAAVITGVPARLTATGMGATEELADLSPPCWPGADNFTLWYRFASPVDRQVRIDTTDSTEETWVTVATGTCGALTPIDCDHDSGVNAHGVVDFLARAGMSYLVQVSRYFPPRVGDRVEISVQDGLSAPLTVHVTDGATGADLEGAHVQVRDVEGGFYLLREGWTDARGEVTLHVSRPDLYDVQVIAPLHRVGTGWYDVGTAALRAEFALAPMTGIRVPSDEPTRIAMSAEQSLVTFLPDGSDERVIPLPGFASVRFPTWSPDGAAIAFEGVGPGASYHEIWIVGHDGSGLRQLTRFDGDPGRQMNLAWSPDGQELAFAWFADLFATAFTIHVVDAATGRDVRLLEIGDDPTWSPDSSMIAYVAPWGSRVMRRDGSNVATLNPFTATSVEWSPDGTRLALSSGNESILAIPIDGRYPVKVAATQSNYQTLPSWSPDSCQIAFADQELSVGYLDIAWANGDGFRSPWLADARGEFEWSRSPTPPDVAGDRAPRVALLDPDGGELLEIGKTYAVGWQASDDRAVTSQDLYLLANGERTPIASGLSGALSSYPWTVTGPASDSGARIQVVVHDAAGQEHRDASRYPFSIAGPADPYHRVRLTWPAAGARLEAGDVVRITWEADLRSVFTPDGFHLELSFDGGNSYRDTINDFVPQSDRQFDWTVPEYASAEAAIRIRNVGALDESGVFTITAAAAEGRRTGGTLLLLGVRSGSEAVFSWAGSGVNLHRTDRKQDLPGVWGQPAHAASQAGTWSDPEPAPGPAAPWFYQVFWTDCAGSSLP